MCVVSALFQDCLVVVWCFCSCRHLVAQQWTLRFEASLCARECVFPIRAGEFAQLWPACANDSIDMIPQDFVADGSPQGNLRARHDIQITHDTRRRRRPWRRSLWMFEHFQKVTLWCYLVCTNGEKCILSSQLLCPFFGQSTAHTGSKPAL